MAKRFELAHISDPHLSPLPRPRAAELMGKRLLGYLSWQRRRRHIHRAEVLEALVKDLASRAPSHLAITGDLTNISLPGEFSQAADWLRRLGLPAAVTVVPGNHDAYVRMDWSQSWQHWADYMSCDQRARSRPEGFGDFPFLQRRGPLALIGLSTALPTPPAFATGRLGGGQIEALERLLEQTAGEGLCRVVLLHHPPAGDVGRRKCLTDAGDFCAVIARQGAELVLHGHDHTMTRVTIPGPTGPVPVHGVPSTSAIKGTRRHPSARYLIYQIEQRAAAWRITVECRAYDSDRGAFLAEDHPLSGGDDGNG